jgi:hypothetical protein
MNWTQEEIEKGFQAVKKKAMVDKKFRALAVANPNKAIQEVTGKNVPAGFSIKIVESDPAYHMTFVLPEMVTEELSDAALESVSGGAVGCVAVGEADGIGACAAAVSLGPCAAYACGAKASVR